MINRVTLASSQQSLSLILAPERQAQYAWCQSRTAVTFPFSLPLLYKIMGNACYSEPLAFSNSETCGVYLLLREGPFVYQKNQSRRHILFAGVDCHFWRNLERHPHACVVSLLATFAKLHMLFDIGCKA